MTFMFLPCLGFIPAFVVEESGIFAFAPDMVFGFIFLIGVSRSSGHFSLLAANGRCSIVTYGHKSYPLL